MPRATEPDDNDPDAVCRVGLVHGLVARADLNGRLARAVRWVPTKGRWALIMDGGEKVLVKDDNIDFQAPEAIEADLMIPSRPAVRVPVISSSSLKLPADAVVTRTPPPPPALITWLLRCFCVPVAEPPKLPLMAPSEVRLTTESPPPR